MRRNSLIILVAVLVVLAGLYFILSAARGRGTLKAPKQTIAIDSTQVSTVEFINGKTRVILENNAGSWVVKDTMGKSFEANMDYINRLVSSLGQLKLETVISESPDKFARFQVDTAMGTLVKVKSGNKDYTFYLGKAGADYRSQYLRFPGKNKVYLASANLQGDMHRRFADWRNKNVLALKWENIASTDAITPKGKIGLTKQDSVWTVTVDDATMNADSAKAARYLKWFENLRCTDFVDDPDSAAKISFAKPNIALRIELLDETAHTIEGVYADTTKRRYIVKRDNESAPLYLFYAGSLERFYRDTTYFKHSTPPPSPPPGAAMGGGGQQISPQMREQIMRQLQQQKARGR